MGKYHKINTVFKRDMEKKGHPLIAGDWSCPEFKYLANNRWCFTEKIHGMNVRVMIDNGITFGGRTDDAQIPAKLGTRLNELFLPRAKQLIEMFPLEACLYGEGYGPKINNGGGYRIDQDFILFDVRVGGWWLQRKDVEEVATKLNIDVVPVIGYGTLNDAVDLAWRGITSKFGDFQAEGIVARPVTELKTRSGARVIAKIKCGDFK